MLVDYHVHTHYSDDSDYPMEDVVRDAVSLGLDEICFTDHVDYGIKRDWDDPRGIIRSTQDGVLLANVDYPRYFDEIALYREKYRDRISIKAGLEFGIQMHTIPQFERVFHSYPLDFVILSVHQVEDKEFWTQDFQRGRTQEEYNFRYFEEMLDLVYAWHDYSVLGHLDLISRYDEAGKFPFERIRPVVAEILKTAIADGKGIEVNTSCYRYGLDDLTPSTDILKLYRDLGGEILTIGSDSHKKEHLGARVSETMRYLKELGFQSFHTFDKMEPVAHIL